MITIPQFGSTLAPTHTSNDVEEYSLSAAGVVSPSLLPTLASQQGKFLNKKSERRRTKAAATAKAKAKATATATATATAKAAGLQVCWLCEHAHLTREHGARVQLWCAFD